MSREHALPRCFRSVLGRNPAGNVKCRPGRIKGSDERQIVLEPICNCRIVLGTAACVRYINRFNDIHGARLKVCQRIFSFRANLFTFWMFFCEPVRFKELLQGRLFTCTGGGAKIWFLTPKNVDRSSFCLPNLFRNAEPLKEFQLNLLNSSFVCHNLLSVNTTVGAL